MKHYATSPKCYTLALTDHAVSLLYHDHKKAATKDEMGLKIGKGKHI